jgi:FAD/FMN-containing dehydrogenase
MTTIKPSIGESVKLNEHPSLSDINRSSACSALLPGCILVPDSAAQVSLIVKTLLENDEKFAIKSGGHNPNQNFSSVAGGPLINLKNLTEVTYDAESGTARVGAGNRWSAVILALQTYNVTVVGGRIGHVGVGGYLLGGEYGSSRN